MNDKTVWGIHGGRTGDADTLFRKKNYIALGWSRVGNLAQIPATRDAFKETLVRHYPDKKPGAVPVEAGQLFRFVHEMQNGDLVVYPSSVDRQIHIGEVSGAYVYHPDEELGYPHRRPVKWLRSVPRTQFTQGALYETGSAMSFFQIRNYADEFLAALEGKMPLPQPATEDETVALVVEDIEQTTADFIHKQLAKELKGHAFADFVAHLLQRMGYRTRVSPPGPDTGIDIIAHKDELGFEPPFIKVQVKSVEGSIGAPEVQALYGNIDNSQFGLFVTLGRFTSQAQSFARGKGNLRLIDGNELVGLILQYYDQFDSHYKGLLPLKRVFIPQVLEDGEE
jgi:restriction system protein